MATAGTLKVSNDVIADLSGYAALECYGVVGMADTTGGVARLLPWGGLRRGIGVAVEDGTVVVDLHVIVEQGVNVAQVSSNLVSAVSFVLSTIAELDDARVRVHVDGIRTAR